MLLKCQIWPKKFYQWRIHISLYSIIEDGYEAISSSDIPEDMVSLPGDSESGLLSTTAIPQVI